MCGIAGLVFDAPTVINHPVAHRLSAPIHHRGPDDQGWCALADRGVLLDRSVEGKVGSRALLVHRRLSILDLTEAGRQPMATPDGRYVIVYNGEVYNFLELRSELEDLGRRFRSHSDTEVLLHGYAQWGLEVLRRLTGMFAFALLDAVERRLLLARDFFGIKPLYYTFWRDGFAFASELKPLLDLPGVDRRVNPPRLYEYLRGGLTDYGAETLFANIRQLPAAHYLELPLDHPRVLPEPVRYWEIDLDSRSELSFPQAARQLRELFLESVRLHLRSDVPVGAALSGGIDSSSIVAAMRLLNPDQEIHTFSYVADDPALSEERWVDLVGTGARTVVHKVGLNPQELAAGLERLVDLQGEPFASSSIYSQHRVFEAARAAGIKVMLDGQGADELLGGYDVYAAARLASLIRRGQWRESLAFWRGASRVPRKTQLWQLLGPFLFPSSVQTGLRRLVGREPWPAWMNRSWFQERVPAGGAEAHGGEDLHEALRRTLVHSSLPMLLRYEDRNSMAYSIESRVPFLTPRLARFVLSLPAEYLISPRGTSKAVFRAAMRGLVPDPVLDRREKIGFETPERQWLCDRLRPWVDGLLGSEEMAAVDALNRTALSRDWKAVIEGRRRFDNRIWRWINLVIWVRLNGVCFD